MPRCPYCRRDLPGLETTCQNCFQAGYDRLVHPQSWWQRLGFHPRPRLARNNLFGFCFLLVFFFVRLRFDFPYLHARHMKTTATSLVVSTLIACVAFFYEGKREPGISYFPSQN
jgi:hypothetical protein